MDHAFCTVVVLFLSVLSFYIQDSLKTYGGYNYNHPGVDVTKNGDGPVTDIPKFVALGYTLAGQLIPLH